MTSKELARDMAKGCGGVLVTVADLTRYTGRSERTIRELTKGLEKYGASGRRGGFMHVSEVAERLIGGTS